MLRYKNTFLRITASSTIRQMIPKAFISPPGCCITSCIHSLNELMGLMRLKKLPCPAACNASSFLKTSSKNGLSRPSDITEKSVERMLDIK